MLKLPADLSAVPITSLDPREHGSKFWVYDQKDLHICLSSPLLKPTWPDIDAFICEAERVLDDYESRGVTDFTPTVDDVRDLIVQKVAEYQTSWARRAEDPGDNKQAVAKAIGDLRPTRGVPNDELWNRIQEEDPAAQIQTFHAARIELLESGKLKLEDHEWTGHDGEPTRGECYILGVDASDKTAQSSGVADTAEPSEAVSEKLKDSHRQAYYAHELAEKHMQPPPANVEEVYEWLREDGHADYSPPPTLESFSRYVRQATAYFDKRSNTPRGGRTGRSIVSQAESEQPRSDDE